MGPYSDIVSAVSLVVSCFSVVIAIGVYRVNIRQVSGDVLYRIVDRLEAPAMREIRRAIYSLDRDKYAEWDEQMCSKIDTWGAELDVLSTLLSQDGETHAFFMLYGDVILRSIYQLAPYANYQRAVRGQQFWLPLQRFGGHLLRLWRKSVKRAEYMPVVGLPNWPKIKLSHDTFLVSDKECKAFLQIQR